MAPARSRSSLTSARIYFPRYVEWQQRFVAASYDVDSSNGFLKVVGEKPEIPEPLRRVSAVMYPLVLAQSGYPSLTRASGGLAFIADREERAR